MTTYYVDGTSGSDSNTGTTAATAWATVSKVNAATFSAGDIILFHRGQTWSGTTLLPPSSGSSSAMITFGAYGAGAQPIIQAAAQTSSLGLSAARSYLAFEDIHFRYGTGAVVNLSNGNNMTLTRLTIDGDAAQKANGIELYNAAATCHHITITSCLVYSNRCRTDGGAGILIGSATTTGPASVTIIGCTIYSNGTTSLDHGVYLGASSGAIVRQCDIYSNYGKGIHCNSNYLATALVERNKIHGNNIGIGMNTIANGQSVIIQNNLIYSNVRGIWFTAGALAGTVNHNTLVNNTDGSTGGNGIRFSSTVAGATVQYNLIVQDRSAGVGDGEHCIWVNDTTVLTSNTIDYNLSYYPGQTSSHVNAVGTGRTWANWQGSTGTPDVHGVNANPLLMSATDFRLLSTSPARNVGSGVSVTTDYNGLPRPFGTTYDIGAFEYAVYPIRSFSLNERSFTFSLAVDMSNRQMQEVQVQGSGESIPYDIDTTKWGGSPYDVTVTLYSVAMPTGALTDVSSTKLSGSPIITGNLITTPFVTGLTAGTTYRMEVQWSYNGAVLEPYGYIKAEV